ncbi:hypothetical protein [uncultured Sphingomonas sp.]|uniref:hypothetical protein n=1 Tax=uncultured Sphingomonas sp. TaxID=158754 RepID=UPI0037492B8C
MMAALLLMGVMILLRCCPNLPVSRWLSAMLVDAPARRLNRVSRRQWGVVIAGVALIGLAMWFEVDEIRLIALGGESMGELVMMASAIEWGGLVELSLVAILSSSMLARWPIARRFVVRRSARRTVRARHSQRAANDSGDGDRRGLIAA